MQEVITLKKRLAEAQAELDMQKEKLKTFINHKVTHN